MGFIPSARAEATTRRTYNRPLDSEGTKFETWERTIKRSHHDHHIRLWEDAGGKVNLAEIEELVQLGLDRSGTVAGRTLWLGGTNYAYSRSCSQFNCAALEISNVYNIVDAFWLLLNGCGVGAICSCGTLQGYVKVIDELRIIPSERDKDYRGNKDNVEIKPNADNDYTWTIKVGDSAEAWAKALGKMLISPRGKINRLILDFTECRGRGGRLKGYGWLCNGSEPLSEMMAAVHCILNRYAGNFLDEEAISDIFNWCGTVLSSRRAAESLVLPSWHPLSAEFIRRKFEYWKENNQRRQSNNSILFWHRPSMDDIVDLLRMNYIGGEPGFVNALNAILRCPWFKLFNPCFEICLPSCGFCNLVSLCLPHFKKDFAKLRRAIFIMARANYRQTCVNLLDPILQPAWNQTNEALRLCGVSLTGIVQAPWLTDYQIRILRNEAICGAYSMADELGMPRPKAVTTIKPEGTRSKIAGSIEMEIAEGMHLPLGRFIHNWINFSVDDPMVHHLEIAGYRTMLNPSDQNNMLVRFPIEYSGCPFMKYEGKEVNAESAISQLERYQRWNTLWADHNVSATVSFSLDEIPDTARWIHQNWDKSYVATAFIARGDPTKSAQDMGHPYLPQEVITEEQYEKSTSKLKPIDWEAAHTGWYEIEDVGCIGGVCPTK